MGGWSTLPLKKLLHTFPFIYLSLYWEISICCLIKGSLKRLVKNTQTYSGKNLSFRNKWSFLCLSVKYSIDLFYLDLSDLTQVWITECNIVRDIMQNNVIVYTQTRRPGRSLAFSWGLSRMNKGPAVNYLLVSELVTMSTNSITTNVQIRIRETTEGFEQVCSNYLDRLVAISFSTIHNVMYCNYSS